MLLCFQAKKLVKPVKPKSIFVALTLGVYPKYKCLLYGLSIVYEALNMKTDCTKNRACSSNIFLRPNCLQMFYGLSYNTKQPAAIKIIKLKSIYCFRWIITVEKIIVSSRWSDYFFHKAFFCCLQKCKRIIIFLKEILCACCEKELSLLMFYSDHNLSWSWSKIK